MSVAAPGGTIPLPASATELFGGTSRDSNAIIDIGGNSAVLVTLTPSGPQTATAQCSLTVKTANSPIGPFQQAASQPAHIGILTSSTPNTYLIGGMQRYVSVYLAITAGNWQVTWSAASSSAADTTAQAIDLSGSTGLIPASNAATAITISLGSLANASGGVVDAREALVIVSNVGTGQIIGGTGGGPATNPFSLIFSDVSANGHALSLTYTMPRQAISGNTSAISSGNAAYFLVPLTQGVLRNVSLTLFFHAAPTAGQADVQVLLRSSGAQTQDATQGKTLLNAVVDVATAITKNIASTGYGDSIRVASYQLVAAGATTLQWVDSVNGALTGVMTATTGEAIGQATVPPAWVLATWNQGTLQLINSAAVQVSGNVVYWIEPVVTVGS